MNHHGTAAGNLRFILFMNLRDTKIVEDGLKELFGETGPAYRTACRNELKAQQEKRDAETAVQFKFRPHWIAITNIIRCEMKKRGITGDFGCGGRGEKYRGEHVYFEIDKSPSAVSIGHIEYDTCPSIHVQVWIGHGVELKWNGYAKTAKQFARKFDVFLATLDGYISGVKAAGGKDCASCGMPNVSTQYKAGKCERCKTCRDGSLWL